MANVYDFTVKDRMGNDVNLGEYAGKVLLIPKTSPSPLSKDCKSKIELHPRRGRAEFSVILKNLKDAGAMSLILSSI